jgi:uncharacterized Ntn-hydrolase superfamily protein
MRFKIFLLALSFYAAQLLRAQDTFSILAFDSITGEVGAAGASCVDLFQFSGYANDFIAELFPGKGAVVTQASYLPANQITARDRFNLGDGPSQLLTFVAANDAQNNASVRQYGVVRFDTIYPRAAAFTGINCLNYKNHIVGPNYSIQGNILLGQKVLDSMEVRFNREQGDLACKLMAALQGAKMIGADSRCATNGSSSLFAFIKTSVPNDNFGAPNFLLSLKTPANAGIEPIDSLQKMFTKVKNCNVITTALINSQKQQTPPEIYPNPASNKLFIKTGDSLSIAKCVIRDIVGQTIVAEDFISEINFDTSNWRSSVIFVEITVGNNKPFIKKVILN